MEEKNNFLVPVAIIIAGALIAWGLMSDKTEPTNNGGEPTVTLAPVTSDDHILGDPEADMIIVEYSDLECPYCKNYHFTTKKIMDDYGKDGKVALVFRQFPIDSLHSKARPEAIATECAAELGGNSTFWEYLDLVFEATPSNNGLDLAELPNMAEQVGLDRDEFIACLDDEKMADRVKAQQETGITAGVNGTPASFIVTKDGNQFPIPGAQPYDDVKLMIETILENK